jgi:hypothetical protein
MLLSQYFPPQEARSKLVWYVDPTFCPFARNLTCHIVKIIEPFTVIASPDVPASSKGRLSAQSSTQEMRNSQHWRSTPSPSPSRDGLQSNLSPLLSSGVVPMPAAAETSQQPMTHQVQDEETRPLLSQGTETHVSESQLLREMQVRMERVERITNEMTHMSGYMQPPPAYIDNNGAGMHNDGHIGSEN